MSDSCPAPPVLAWEQTRVRRHTLLRQQPKNDYAIHDYDDDASQDDAIEDAIAAYCDDDED